MRTLALCSLVLSLPAGLAVAGDVLELPAPSNDGLVIQPATVAVSQPGELPAFDDGPADDDWKIVISPMASPKAEDASPAMGYQRAYDSIPFSRAEWLANASYRHDSAMALLTGQPINGRTAPTRMLEEYQNPRTYRRTFFPRLSPADLHYKYSYGFGPYGFPFGLPYGGGWGGGWRW